MVGRAFLAGMALLLGGCASMAPPYERPAAPVAAVCVVCCFCSAMSVPVSCSSDCGWRSAVGPPAAAMAPVSRGR